MSRLKPAAPFTSTQTRLRLASMEHLARLVERRKYSFCIQAHGLKFIVINHFVHLPMCRWLPECCR